MRSLEIGDPVGGKFQARIERNDAVTGIGKIPGGGERAEVGLLAEFARDAHYAIERACVVLAARKLSLTWRAVVNQDRTERPVAGFSGHARSELGVLNPAGEEKIDRGLQEAGILDEERAFFREKYG